MKQVRAAFGEDWPVSVVRGSHPEPLDYCLNTVNKLLCSILQRFLTSEYQIYLTGEDNFREKIYPEYKANRKDAPKPTHLLAIREYLVEHWGAIVVDGQEADDALATEQSAAYQAHHKLSSSSETVICSQDKDLLMIPGWHYNWGSEARGIAPKLQWVTEEQGIRSFYKQLLTGDSVDNIPGIKGVGPVKAERALEGCETPKEMWDAALGAWVLCLWRPCHPDENEDQYEFITQEVTRNARLLWMRTKEGEVWEPPR